MPGYWNFFCFLLIAATQTAFGVQADLITNIENRTLISLNGPWHFIVDPYENGFYDYRYQENPNGYFKNAKVKNKWDLVEYNFDDSETLNVPGDWNSQKEKLFFYEGTVWYEKSFPYRKREGRRVFLHFGAVNYHSIVYLNGVKLGENEGGFTPFNFEITDQIADGANFVVVKVDNKRRRDAVPTLNTDWWNYGGITRDVDIVETPETFVQDYFIQPKKGSLDEVEGWVQLNGVEKDQRIEVHIPEAGFSKSFKTDKNGRADVSFRKELILCSPLLNTGVYDLQICL